MYTRVHTFKFQNKLAKNSIKLSMKQISDPMFDKGLQMRFFVDVNDTTLNVINVWDNEQNSAVVHQNNNDFIKEMKEMGVNMLITGGKTEASYSDKTNFSDFTKLE
jgi:hypothetical protein|tara:strand:+ start:105 stop:422 length:318 start_codon:yes stop_codon:yes gene_type:complete